MRVKAVFAEEPKRYDFIFLMWIIQVERLLKTRKSLKPSFKNIILCNPS